MLEDLLEQFDEVIEKGLSDQGFIRHEATKEAKLKWLETHDRRKWLGDVIYYKVTEEEVAVAVYGDTYKTLDHWAGYEYIEDRCVVGNYKVYMEENDTGNVEKFKSERLSYALLRYLGKD